MATHYKGQRISDLLDEISRYEEKLARAGESMRDDDAELIIRSADAWTALVLAKAKLTALQGDDK